MLKRFFLKGQKVYCCELCRTKNIWYTKMAKVSYKAGSHPERGIEKHLGRMAFHKDVKSKDFVISQNDKGRKRPRMDRAAK